MSNCEHLQAYVSQETCLQKIAALQRAVRTTSVQPARALDEPVTPRPPRRTPAFACLVCAAGFATRAQAATHQTDSGHALALDTKRLEILCCSCGDYVFSHAVDTAVSAARCAAATNPAGAQPPDRQPMRPPSPPPPPADLEDGLGHAGSELAASSQAAGADSGSATPSAAPPGAPDGVPQGLRGLNNLGNTCFMNSVLQAMLHAPLLRQFFLSEGHPAGGCRRSPSAHPCLSCELDSLFGEMYSGGRVPVSPVAFLSTWWHTAGGHLEGYQQQDAHEFYLNALSGLSTSLATPSPSEEGAEEVQSQEWGTSLGVVPAPANGVTAPSSPPHHPQPVAGPCGSPTSPVLLPAIYRGSSGHDGFPELSAAADQLPHSSPQLVPDHLSNQQPNGQAAALPATSQSFASSICTDDGEADGIVQRVFGGLLRSDVTCRACGHTSTAFDPFLDLSLDLPPAPNLPQVWQRSSAAKPPRPVALAPQASARPPRPPQPPSALYQPPDASDNTGASTPHLRGAVSGCPGGKGASPEPQLMAIGTQSGSASGTTRSTSVELDLSRTQTPCSSGGSQSVYRDASSVSPRHSEASSINEGTQGDAPTSVSVADGTVEPGPSPQSPPLPKAVAGLRAPKSKAAVSGARGRRGQHRRTRCGDCHHCRHPNLKKACLDPRQGTPSAIAEQQLAVPQASLPLAATASDPGPAPQLLGMPDSAEDGMLEASGTTDGGGVEHNDNGCTSTASAGNGSMRTASGTAAAQQRVGGGPVSKAATAAAAGGTSLVGCLTRFVRPEKLGPRDHWQCARCRARQRAVKQMSIARLPPVLAMHVKRFEAGGMHSQAPRKLATPVSFPLDAALDMRPYLSSSVLAQRCGLRLHDGEGKQDAAEGDDTTAAAPPDTSAAAAAAAQYRAYAVVCHYGNMQGGHYIAYIRAGDQWYLCDDGWVGAVPAPQVRQAQAFQLFYARADLASS